MLSCGEDAERQLMRVTSAWRGLLLKLPQLKLLRPSRLRVFSKLRPPKRAVSRTRSRHERCPTSLWWSNTTLNLAARRPKPEPDARRVWRGRIRMRGQSRRRDLALELRFTLHN